jgi:hypothetical protein
LPRWPRRVCSRARLRRRIARPRNRARAASSSSATESQKTEVFHAGQGIVRVVTRYGGETLLETTLYEGSAVPPQSVYTDLYSPDLKLVLGREYKHRDGQTQVIKYDRIYALKN